MARPELTPRPRRLHHAALVGQTAGHGDPGPGRLQADATCQSDYSCTSLVSYDASATVDATSALWSMADRISPPVSLA